MKRLIPLACALTVAACASSDSGSSTAPKAKLLQPDVEMVQLVGPADLNYPAGEMEVQFGLRITNRSAETIKLKQVEMTPVGQGGPYTVIRRTYYFNQDVAPNGSKAVDFWAKADADGDAYAGDAQAPVSLRAVAVFDSPAGAFRKVLMRTFPQQGRGPTGSQ